MAGVLRAGARGSVRFRFKYRPEFINVGDRLIFREGKTKGIGNVAKLITDPNEELKAPSTVPIPSLLSANGDDSAVAPLPSPSPESTLPTTVATGAAGDASLASAAPPKSTLQPST